MVFQLLRAIHILPRLGANHFFGLRVLFPFEGEHEQLERGVVALIGLFVFAGIVVFDGFFDGVDGSAEEVGVTHFVVSRSFCFV